MPGLLTVTQLRYNFGQECEVPADVSAAVHVDSAPSLEIKFKPTLKAMGLSRYYVGVADILC